MTGELFDDPPELAIESKKPIAKGRLTRPEQLECNNCYREALATKDSDKIALAMGVALWRLGAEPLNEMAEILLRKLEQEGII